MSIINFTEKVNTQAPKHFQSLSHHFKSLIKISTNRTKFQKYTNDQSFDLFTETESLLV